MTPSPAWSLCPALHGLRTLALLSMGVAAAPLGLSALSQLMRLELGGQDDYSDPEAGLAR